MSSTAPGSGRDYQFRGDTPVAGPPWGREPHRGCGGRRIRIRGVVDRGDGHLRRFRFSHCRGRFHRHDNHGRPTCGRSSHRHRNGPRNRIRLRPDRAPGPTCPGSVIADDWHGRPWHDTTRAIAESLAIARTLLEGGRTDHAGRCARSRGFRLRVKAPGAHITVAAFGRRSLRLAAGQADRVVLNMVTVDTAARIVMSLAEAAAAQGRDRPPPVALWLLLAAGAASSRWPPTLSMLLSITFSKVRGGTASAGAGGAAGLHLCACSQPSLAPPARCGAEHHNPAHITPWHRWQGELPYIVPNPRAQVCSVPQSQQLQPLARLAGTVKPVVECASCCSATRTAVTLL